MRKLLITGSQGLLGGTLLKRKRSSLYEIEALDRRFYCQPINEVKLLDEISKILPTTIIHCAAITDVDWCERNTLDCYEVNTKLTSILSKICNILNIKLVFISSTGIYGNWKNSSYIETDKVIPTTVHHRSKFEAENHVKKLVKDYLIIRTGWLFGGSTENPKNFIVNRLKEIYAARCEDGILFANDRQLGNPTYVGDVADRVFQLIHDDVNGIYNCVNHGFATRLQYVKAIALAMQIDIEIKHKDFHRIAPVSNNESATNHNMLKLGYDDLPFWEDSLKAYIDGICIVGQRN
ncbi:TPA: NAD(P)-dependent oxidoreductase [Shewanella algae]|uniref:SDR family oxidoreductase n=1 Tax=Shewanella algae TaxID=38313 RepID=UPI001C5993CA|nr:sugar nucleotide-binding protein [Shewanella algae]HDS1207148.1 NAD(P)-dependent oxidoreductase [Shewanella algae]